MTTPGIVPDPVEDSVEPVVSADDTLAGEGHTPEPEPESIDDLLAKLEARKAEIPPEKLASFNPQMQQGFNRRLNLLNKSIEPVAKKMLDDAGVELPAGKTVMDLLTDGDGKEFFRIWDEHQAKRMQPVVEHINKERMAQQIQEWSGFAQREFPIVASNFETAVKIVSQDPDLIELAKVGDWRGLPLVLQGAAYKVAYDKLLADNAKLQKLIDASKVATRAKTTTSLAGGPANGGAEPASVESIEQAINKAWQKVQEGVA